MCFSAGIHLQFLNFSTEAIHDYLEIRSGTLETGSVIDRFSGPVIPKPLFSTTHQTSFFFHSDYSQNKPGFRITYQGNYSGNCFLQVPLQHFGYTVHLLRKRNQQMSSSAFCENSNGCQCEDTVNGFIQQSD